jgi:protein O-GlcNAc transferase
LLTTRCLDHGIAAQRLTLEGPSDRADYLAAYSRVDVALDPFPFPGGTTSVEALWMGVPVVTLVGDRFVSRQALGLLKNAGLPDWIAYSQAQSITIAKEKTRDPAELTSLRSRLRAQLTDSAAFDGARFAGHFGSALRGMWEATGVPRVTQS